MLQESVLKLNQLLQQYSQSKMNDSSELLILEQQLQHTTSEFHALKVSYEKYHEIWRELLLQIEYQPTDAIVIRQVGSGKKSLLKQQLSSNIDPLLATVQHLNAVSIKELDTLTKLIDSEPVFQTPTFVTDSEIQLDRLIEMHKNQINKETSPICSWIIEYWSCIERFTRIFDQYINLISKYEAKLQNSIKTSSELSIQKQLKLSSDEIKKKSISEKELNPSKDSCIQCCQF
ncbi:unnamed protein product [Paramecium primaurelia]|uniref:Uncharacterized protein n=2 Tax=Paramecium TaxID=5884 RepID=A0A8S1XEX0_9CILI|nr:unnamed protein product [Paramecium primaurelia]CAD8199687.1 unnamed protein product [Paramecium pentaurelia]